MKKKHHIAFSILLAIIGLLEFAILELNKNRVIGWVLALLVLIAFGTLYKKKLSAMRWWTKCLGWLACLLVLGGIVFGTVGPYKLVPAVDEKNPQVTEAIHISQGDLTGVMTGDGQVEVFAGVPYAKPPVGDLRWKEPQNPEPWEGTLAADHFAPMSMQPANSQIYNSLAQIIGYHDYKITLDDNYRTMMSEDSLYLNIWKPADVKEGAPVLVYVHGGSLQTGQPWYQDYAGETFAREGVVVVNMGYRLGVFGYYADEALAEESPNGTTGNYGLLDQIKALEWVQQNISAFGGDPDNVTLAGESAGAAAVSAICTSPLAKGLFNRVVAESSTTEAIEPTHSFRLLDEALATGAETRADLGIGKAKTSKEVMESQEEYQSPERTAEERKNELAAMRALPAEELVAKADVNHHMTVDGYGLTETPYESYQQGRHNEEAILHGFNKKEGETFLLFNNASMKDYRERIEEEFGEFGDQVEAVYPAASDEEASENWKDIFTAEFFSYGHYCWSRLAVENQEPVYEYYFTKDNGRLGSWHSGEEVYLYGNIPTGKETGANLYTEEDLNISETFHSYVLNFIRTGDPNGKAEGTIVPERKGQELPVWRNQLDLTGDETQVPGTTIQEIGSNVGEVEDPFLAFYEVMDTIQGWK